MKKTWMALSLLVAGCLGDPKLPQKPQIEPDRTEIAFGGDFTTGADAVWVNTVQTETLQLRNGGTDALSITAMSLSGANAGLFTVAINPDADAGGVGTLPKSVASRERAFAQVTYAPKAAGKHEATLTITSNAENSPTLVVPLHGTAVAK